MLDRIAYCIQASVSNTCDLVVIVILMDRCLCYDTIFLLKVAFVHTEDWFCTDIMILKNTIYNIRCQFLMSLVRNIFYHVSDFFSHLLRQADTEALLQNIVYATFS